MNASLAGRHIGFYTSVIGHGGSEVLVADAIEAAVEAGARVTVWSGRNAAIRTILRARSGLNAVAFRDWPRHGTSHPEPHPTSGPISPRRRNLKSMVLALLPVWWLRARGFRRDSRLFTAELQQCPCDLFVVNVNGSEAASVGGALAGTPVVNIYHLSYTDPPGHYFMRRGDHAARSCTLRAGARTIHTSFAVRDQWSRRYREAIDKSHVIYNGVNHSNSKTSREELRKQYDINDSRCTIIVPARLDAIKGHIYLIHAIHLLDSELRPRVWLCGEGALRPNLQAAIELLQLTKSIAMLGQRSDLPQLLAAADVVVLPSVASENLSVAVLEGLAAGTPAIVTAVGGMAEAVRHGETGLVVPPADPPALAAAIVELIGNAEKRFEMGRNARADWEARFQRSRMKADYVKVFAEVLSCARA